MGFIRLNYKNIFFALILTLAIFLRFNQLGTIPSGLTNDEAGVGWDAYSILNTERDQWNQFLPLRFIAYGDYPAPILRYITIPSVYFFDLNSFSTRLPSASVGVLSVIILFFLSRKLFNKKIAIFSSLLMAISPWAIGLSRVTIEPNVAIFFFLLSFYLYIKSKDNIKYLFLSAVSFAAVLYTYSAYVLFLPLVALALIVFDRKTVIGNWKNYFVAAFIFVILVIPNFVSKNTTANVRFSQVGITNNINSIGFINVLNDQRGSCLGNYNSYVCKIVDNKAILFTTIFAKNYISHFNVNTLYNSGTPTQFSILPQRGLEYAFEVIFLLFGVIKLVKIKDKNGYLILTLFLLSPIPDSLTGDGHYGRASIMIPMLLIVEGLGLVYLIDIVSKYKSFYINKFIYIILTLIFFLSVFSFWINYTTYFKNYYSINSQYGYEDLMIKTYALRNDYKKIFVSKHLNDTKQYVYYLFYNKYNPVSFQKKINVDYKKQDDGWISIDRIDNVYFVENPPSAKDLKSLRDSLIISNPVDFPIKLKSVFVVKDMLGNIIFKAIRSNDLLEYNRQQEELLRLNQNEKSSY